MDEATLVVESSPDKKVGHILNIYYSSANPDFKPVSGSVEEKLLVDFKDLRAELSKIVAVKREEQQLAQQIIKSNIYNAKPRVYLSRKESVKPVVIHHLIPAETSIVFPITPKTRKQNNHRIYYKRK